MTPNLLNYVQFSSWCTAEPFFLKRICKAVYLYSDKKNEKIRIQLIISGCHKQVKKNHLISILKKILGWPIHYELPLSKIIKFQLWWKPMVYVLIRAYLSNLSWKKCSKKIFVIGKNWKSDQKISGLLSKYFINWS